MNKESGSSEFIGVLCLTEIQQNNREIAKDTECNKPHFCVLRSRAYPLHLHHPRDSIRHQTYWRFLAFFGRQSLVWEAVDSISQWSVHRMHCTETLNMRFCEHWKWREIMRDIESNGMHCGTCNTSDVRNNQIPNGFNLIQQVQNLKVLNLSGYATRSVLDMFLKPFISPFCFELTANLL